MSISTDRDHFFQTSTSLEAAERRAAKSKNTNGNPIVLSSKILALIPDPWHKNHVYVAESGGVARRVDLSKGKDGKQSHSYKGHTAPVTSLTLDHTGKMLFTGSWDKIILAFDTESRQVLRTFSGHSDFVKCLLHIPPTAAGPGLLLSGSADATIAIWNANTGEKLQTLKGHARGVQDLALDPLQSDSTSYVIYSAGSERDIRQWKITPSADGTVKAEEENEPILENETSVYKIRLCGEDYEMWTASADKTARSIDHRGSRKTDELLKHPDFVNDVLVDDVWDKWVITACRDEHVRVWEKSTGKLYHTFEGHFEEVTGLAMLGTDIVSVSIDWTIRRWSLEPSALKKALEEAKKSEEEKAKSAEEKHKGPVLTEEEERELAELLEEDGD